MKEIWKDIKGYEGLYQVSNLGRIKKLRFINNICNKEKEQIKKLNKRNNYYTINLSKEGKRKNYQVHRLVAQEFIPRTKQEKNVINHKDYNTLNNCVDNLEWCTQKENVNYSKHKMKHRHKTNFSNTGEQYISYREKTNKYKIKIDRKEYKNCETLEEAIKIRNEILNEIDNAI